MNNYTVINTMAGPLKLIDVHDFIDLMKMNKVQQFGNAYQVTGGMGFSDGVIYIDHVNPITLNSDLAVSTINPRVIPFSSKDIKEEIKYAIMFDGKIKEPKSSVAGDIINEMVIFDMEIYRLYDENSYLVNFGMFWATINLDNIKITINDLTRSMYITVSRYIVLWLAAVPKETFYNLGKDRAVI